MTAALPTADQLTEIAEQVWSAYLAEGGHAEVGGTGTVDDAMAASVGVAGAWNGHVVVTCSPDASRDVAAALFAMDAQEVSGEEIGDALGELANVVGGNVKSMLPAPSTLSLPTVADSGRWPGSVEVCRTVLTWSSHPFTVTLLAGAAADQSREKVPA